MLQTINQQMDDTLMVVAGFLISLLVVLALVIVAAPGSIDRQRLFERGADSVAVENPLQPKDISWGYVAGELDTVP